MNAFHSKSCLSSQSSRSSSAGSYGPRRLKRTSRCGGATVEIGSIWRKPSRLTVSSTEVAEPSSSWAGTAIRRAWETVTGVDTTEFVLSQLPPAPARVLEIGTGGEGKLARVLDDAGYDVVAIDPAAPQEEGIFRRLKIEELSEDELFHAIVAVLTLHHVTDLGPALDKIRDHLRPGGALVLEELGCDRLDEATADWFYSQQRALATAKGSEAAASVEELT